MIFGPIGRVVACGVWLPTAGGVAEALIDSRPILVAPHHAPEPPAHVRCSRGEWMTGSRTPACPPTRADRGEHATTLMS